MMTGGSGKNAVYWKTQLPVDYIDTTLVINTFENVVADLSGGKPAKIWRISFEQTNNGATVEDITLTIVLNGTTYTVSRGACVSGTPYYIYVSGNLATGDFELVASGSAFTMGEPGISTGNTIPFIASSVGLIQVKQTTDVDGTSAQIEVNIEWEKLIGV